VKGCRTRGKNQVLPNLKELRIENCGSLTALFVLPPSLMGITIVQCDSLGFILGQDDREFESLHHFDAAVSLEHCNDLASTIVPQQSPAPSINPLPCLES
jgi:hypothetical protein